VGFSATTGICHPECNEGSGVVWGEGELQILRCAQNDNLKWRFFAGSALSKIPRSFAEFTLSVASGLRMTANALRMTARSE